MIENKTPRLVMKDPTKYITYRNAQAIIEATDCLRDRLLFTWLFRSGRRVSEICRGVCRKHVNFEEKTVLYNIKKKKNKYFMAELPIDDHVLGMIKRWIEVDKIGMEHWIIDISRQWADKLIKKYANQVGMNNAHCHQLRHGLAVHGIKSGVDLRTIQKILQHSDLGTTATYLQFTTEDIRKASEKMWD